jgi:hypothetical protein
MALFVRMPFRDCFKGKEPPECRLKTVSKGMNRLNAVQRNRPIGKPFNERSPPEELVRF